MAATRTEAATAAGATDHSCSIVTVTTPVATATTVVAATVTAAAAAQTVEFFRGDKRTTAQADSGAPRGHSSYEEGKYFAA